MQNIERIEKSNAYYDLFAMDVAARSQARDFSRALNAFRQRLTPGGLVIDIGCGTGEHLDWFAAHGVTAIGVEPSARMREIAGEKGHRVVNGAFESLGELGLPMADGIWCAASLLHVPLEEADAVLASLHRQCRAGGVFYATVRLGEGAKWDRFDDEHAGAERLIQLFSEPDLLARVAAAGFEVEESWVEDSTWGRPSRWLSFIARAA
ncbi:MAG TPA: class I SAM-dependent methyltransferase [Candidatus Kapabacteria bacterium]|nr:class I SAM-dependent methyltransferase [Candidatus Kapabacteria bacterium]